MPKVSMKLHGYYRSSTSYRIRIALNLKQIAYDMVTVNLKQGAHLEGEYAILNSYRSVPILQVEGNRKTNSHLFQSLAILNCLERNYPSPSFLPVGPTAQALCEELYFAIASEIHAPNNLQVLKYLREQFGASPDDIETWYSTWILRTFQPVEHRLAAWDWQSAELPFGAPGFLEIVLIPQIYNALRWNTDLSAFPNLRRIEAYCQSLDAFRAAHPDVQPDRPET